MGSDPKKKENNVFLWREATSIKEETRTVGFQLTEHRSNFFLLTPLFKGVEGEREKGREGSVSQSIVKWAYWDSAKKRYAVTEYRHGYQGGDISLGNWYLCE